jgi:hypothetical protein
MHIHKVIGIAIKSQVYGQGKESFEVHVAEFFSSCAAASVEVAFFVEVGRKLTVNGGSQWGECPDGAMGVARVDLHLKGEGVHSEFIHSKTGDYVHNVYSGRCSCVLSYVTPVPVALELSADGGAE